MLGLSVSMEGWEREPRRVGWQAGLVGVLLALPVATAALEYRSGGVLEDGATEHRFGVERFSWAEPPGNDAESRDDVLRLSPSARFGLAAGYDLRVGLPVQQEDDRRDLHGVELELGLPLREGDAGPDVTLAVHGRLLPADPPLGSGSDGLGVAVHLSDRLGERGIRLDGYLGLERGDAALRDGPGYEAVNRLHYANRIEYPLGAGWGVGADVRTVIGLSGEEVQNQFAFVIRPGLSYRPTANTTLRAAAGRELADRGVEPESTVQLSLTHRPQAPAPRRELQARLAELEDRHERMTQEQTGIAQRQARQAGRLSEHGEVIDLVKRRAGTLEVEVVNRSGERQHASEAVARLERLGHHVVRRMERPEASMRDASVVQYREAYEEAAVELGEALPGVQEVYRADPPIGPGADVRLIVGADFGSDGE
ncbi:LytR C-terminal domain-containing protein [Halorhodospira halophila]|uniref:LytR/CpsA/Psr regulator C-terminal domain-containing protein n=1 Tax=Halorhodospira halophila (strain DSM 244 / SL1) TaxID=349124 RepID=A1WYR7_HALHL|nr:LytR C-terminal domain-containing protein [Halorhodospira halophila]ABM62829.1 hypothetical protein Hhal_2065 [Halorhodospira halophila SL1]MBK1728048.1 hypothetical protein [Halorhodospira halophila]